MFMMQESGHPRVFRYAAHYETEQPIFNNMGQQLFDDNGKPLVAKTRQTANFISKEECDRAILDNPQISFEVQEVDVSAIEWVEAHQFATPHDVQRAIEAGEGCNLYLYTKDGLLKAQSIVLLKLLGEVVDEDDLQAAVACLREK